MAQYHRIPVSTLVDVTRSIKGLIEGGRNRHECVTLSEVTKKGLTSTSSGTVDVSITLHGDAQSEVFFRNGGWWAE